jgi:hypothetical protein
MSIAIVHRMPADFNTETYDAVNEKAGIGTEPPKGMIFHALGTSDDGHMIIDVWESEADFDAFRNDRLNPAMKSIVGDEAFEAMPTPERSFYEVHNIVSA